MCQFEVWLWTLQPWAKNGVDKHFFFPLFTVFGQIDYLALDEHIEEVIIRLGAVGVGHQMAKHSLVAVLLEPEARQTSPCC